jgi:hypothetical protein
MTCESIRDAMLEAELSELRGRGDSAIATHLRECLTCRRLGMELVLQTGQLARAVRARPATAASRARGRHGARFAAVAALVGVAATVTVIMSRAPASPAAGTPALVVALPPVVARRVAVPNASRQVHSATPRVVARPAVRRRPSGPAIQTAPFIAQRTVPVPAERAVAVMPVRLEPVQAPEPLGSGVRLELPAGRGATILRTDRPDVTVVWIYPSRTQQ